MEVNYCAFYETYFQAVSVALRAQSFNLREVVVKRFIGLRRSLSEVTIAWKIKMGLGFARRQIMPSSLIFTHTHTHTHALYSYY